MSLIWGSETDPPSHLKIAAAVVGTLLSFGLLASAGGRTKPMPLTCVSVEDETGRLLGVSREIGTYQAADERELKGAVLNHLNLILLQNGRPAVSDLELVDNPVPPLDKPRHPRKPPTLLTSPLATEQSPPPDGCTWNCFCASPFYCSETMLRNNPKDKPGGGICGCAVPCGSCRKCELVCK